MTTFTQFTLYLQDCLQTSPHVFFEHFLLNQPKAEQIIHVLWQQEEDSVFTKLRSFSELQGMVISKKEEGTLLTISFKNGNSCQLYFMTVLLHEGKTFLNANAILKEKQSTTKGVCIPNIEHLFEFGILHHFLNDEGLDEKYQNHFEGFHYFVKEGLLDFFNGKYNTSFTSMEKLEEFNPKEKSNMMEYINHLPANQFLNKMNVRWHNLLGYLRQAKF